MHTVNDVLVAVDGSPLSVEALRWGKDFADRLGAAVTAITAWDPHNHLAFVIPKDFTDEAAELVIDEQLGKLLAEIGMADVTTKVVKGRSSPALHEAAQAGEDRILVMGTRGIGTIPGLLLGSVSRRLLFDCACPLILIPAHVETFPPIDTVVVAVDGSPLSAKVTEWAAPVCRQLGANVSVLRAVDPGMELPPHHVEHYLAEIAEQTDERWCAPFSSAGVEYRTTAERGDPRRVVLAHAAAVGAGLVVVAGRGSGQFQGVGGTTSYLVRRSDVPLAVVPCDSRSAREAGR